PRRTCGDEHPHRAHADPHRPRPARHRLPDLVGAGARAHRRGDLPVPLPPPAVISLAPSLPDWLDGLIARRPNQVTRLGPLLDPVADKLLVAAALLSLVQVDMVPAWMALAII